MGGLPRCVLSVGVSSSDWLRTTRVALRAFRPSLAGRLLFFGRAVCRSMATIMVPGTRAARSVLSSDFS